MAVGRSLSEVGRSLMWTDLRAFMGSLGSESNFWRKVAPEAAEKATRKKELMRVENQLLMSLHDALWDIAYAQAGSEDRLPRLLSTLLDSADGADSAGVAVGDRDVAARDVAASMRRERGDQ